MPASCPDPLTVELILSRAWAERGAQKGVL